MQLLKHVVIFKFKESSSVEEIEFVNQTFIGLKEKIDVIKSFEWGINVSPENFDQGFTHCYVLGFETEFDRDEIYQKHLAHIGFQDVLKPHFEKVFVVDYWAQ